MNTLQLNFSKSFSKSRKIVGSLSLISFIERDVYIIHSPLLDLSGYGNTKEDAEKSFRITLDEFLRYTDDKKTLSKELKKLGWTSSALT